MLHSQTSTVPQDCRSLLSQTIISMGMSPQFTGNTTASGNITYADGRSGGIVMRSLGPSLLQTVTSLPAGVQTVTINAGDAFMDKDGNRTDLALWFAESRFSEAFPHLAVQAWLADASLTISNLAANASLAPQLQQCHIQRLSDGTLEGDSAQQIYDFTVTVDTVAATVTTIHSKWFSSESVTSFMPVDLTYSDYRLVNGMMIPYHLTYSSDGTLMTDIVFTSSDPSSTNTTDIFN